METVLDVDIEFREVAQNLFDAEEVDGSQPELSWLNWKTKLIRRKD